MYWKICFLNPEIIKLSNQKKDILPKNIKKIFVLIAKLKMRRVIRERARDGSLEVIVNRREPREPI